jgi:hypothetical protein
MKRQMRTVEPEYSKPAREEYFLVSAEDMAVLRAGLQAAREGRFAAFQPATYDKVMRAGMRMDHVWGDRPRTLSGIAQLVRDMASGRR